MCTPLWTVMPSTRGNHRLLFLAFNSKLKRTTTHSPVKAKSDWKCSFKTLLFSFLFSFFFCQQGEASVTDSKEAEELLLHNHNQIFIPDDMARKLAEIPGNWNPGGSIVKCISQCTSVNGLCLAPNCRNCKETKTYHATVVLDTFSLYFFNELWHFH